MGWLKKLNPIKSGQPEWPDCDPPHPVYGGGGLSVNNVQYKKVEVSPGHWQWRINEEAMKMLADYEQHRIDLYFALRSRVLTDEEMQEVAHLGADLTIRIGEVYDQTEKYKELNEALLQQFKLKIAQEKANG